MALIGKTNEEKIWNYLYGKIGNAYGVAGLIGNIYCESALNSKNLQQTYEKKLGYTDDTYTYAVDNGTYTNFVKDCAGYGLCQWTYHTRKQNLLNYAKSAKKSIGDLEMQLEFLYKELSEGYKSVLNTLKIATSVLEASNSVLLKYERPADQSETAQNKRAGYGQKYYDKYAGLNHVEESGGGSMKIKANKLIELFEQMYKEHWSYVWSSAKKGCVDCSGAFVYAYKTLKNLYIYHGSNNIARNYVGKLQPVSNAKAGYAAFKWKKKGAPAKYTDGKGNFYHIGLVDDTGKYVLNAKSTIAGFSKDPISKWNYVAPLNDVDYANITSESNKVLYQAVINTQQTPLNFRDEPNGAKIGKIPKGATVDVLNDNGSWWNVCYDGKVGYVSKDYLFIPYKVKVTANTLRIRSGAGTNYSIIGTIRDKGDYVIVKEADGKGATKWGLLKSKEGYISLDYCKKI